MTVKEYTQYQHLEIPVYDTPGWHQYIDRNFHAIDGYMYILTGVTNIRGVWLNSTAYNISDHVVDHLTNTVHQCLIQNTSPATGTFQAYRVANPTHWSAAVTLFQSTSTPSRFEFLNTDDAISTTDASVEFRGGIGVSKRIIAGSYVSIATADSQGLAVGRQGRTDPAFSVWCSTASQVTGIRIVGQAVGNGANIEVMSPNASDYLVIDSKGGGPVYLGGGSSTGPIVARTPFTSQAAFIASTTAAITGNLTVGGTAGIIGNVTMSGTATIAGNLTVNNTVNITSHLTVSGTLNALGSVSVGGTLTLSSGPLLLTGTLNITVTSSAAFMVGQDLVNPAFWVRTDLVANGIKITPQASAPIVIQAVGIDATIDILLEPKGVGSIVTICSSATTGGVRIQSTTVSTSTTTGALRVSGGVGVLGSIHAGSTISAATTFQIAGTNVVGPRAVGWVVPTGTLSRATFVTSTETLPNVAARLGALISDLMGHGLIGT